MAVGLVAGAAGAFLATEPGVSVENRAFVDQQATEEVLARVVGVELMAPLGEQQRKLKTQITHHDPRDRRFAHIGVDRQFFARQFAPMFDMGAQ